MSLDNMRLFFDQHRRSLYPPPIPDGGLRSMARSALKAARGGAKADGTPADAPRRTRAQLEAEVYRRALNRQRFLGDQAAIRAAQAAGPPPDSIAGGAPIRDMPELLAQKDDNGFARLIVATIDEAGGIRAVDSMSGEEKQALCVKLFQTIIARVQQSRISSTQNGQGQFSLVTIQSPPGQPPQCYLMSEERRREIVDEWCRNAQLRS